MIFTYKILKYRPKDAFLQVKYDVDGYDSVIRNFVPPQDVTPETVNQSIEQFCKKNFPVDLFKRQAAVVDIDPESITIDGTDTYVPPGPPPEPEQPTIEEQVRLRIEQLAAERYRKEGEGLVWVDSKGDQWFFDTTIESQNRFAAARLAVESGARKDKGVWKCASLDEFGTPSLEFRKTSNAEIVEIANLVLGHVQKCFETEAVCIQQVMQGNLTVDYDAEFEKL